jgi:hypothetical protein
MHTESIEEHGNDVNLATWESVQRIAPVRFKLEAKATDSEIEPT